VGYAGVCYTKLATSGYQCLPTYVDTYRSQHQKSPLMHMCSRIQPRPRLDALESVISGPVGNPKSPRTVPYWRVGE